MRQSRFGSQILDGKGLEAALQLKDDKQNVAGAEGEKSDELESSCRTSQISASRDSDYFTDEDSRQRKKESSKQLPNPASKEALKSGSHTRGMRSSVEN